MSGTVVVSINPEKNLIYNWIPNPIQIAIISAIN
jgi:hypothetical protein